MKSLQEQLLSAGVIDAKKAKQAAKDKRRETKQQRIKKQQSKGKNSDNTQPIDETKQLIKASMAEKAESDRELNRQREATAQQKAIAAQIKQLIEANQIDHSKGDIAFQFVDNKKIKKLHVTQILQNQLSNGFIAIVKLQEDYFLVPAAVAVKLAQRDADNFVLLNNEDCSNDTVVAEDDPYADFAIPDDLMW